MMNIMKITITNNYFHFLLSLVPKHFIQHGLCGNTEFMAKMYLRKINLKFQFGLGVTGKFLFGKEGSPVASYTVQTLLI